METTFQCGVGLDVFAELVQRGGPDHAQLAAGEHRLDHVAGIHCAFGPTGTDDGVQFIDEGDDFAFSAGDFVENRLQTFFKFSAILRAGQHRTDIE